MNKNNKSQTPIKKSFSFQGPVQSFDVMESLFPEFWGKCSFRVQRVFVSEGVTFITVEAKENENKRHTITFAIEDSVGRVEELPEFEDAIIGSPVDLDGDIVMSISKHFVFSGSRITVYLKESEEEQA